jgi:hypothetical protein
MSRNYEVRQYVKSVVSSWFVVVFESEIERIASNSYAEYKDANPCEYFELIRVDHEEECLAFTPKK